MTPENFYRLKNRSDEYYPELREIYEGSFPLNEQRDQRQQDLAFSRPDYRLEGLIVDGRLLVWVSYFIFNWFFYLEHFAVAVDQRRSGLGGRTLQLLIDKYKHPEKRLILEIEPPVDQISRSRQAFYERLNFRTNPYEYWHPPYQADRPPYPLVVMSQGRELTPAEFADFRQTIENEVMRGVLSPAGSTSD